MIRHPVWDGVAFTEGADGDMRHDVGARAVVAATLGISPDWATVNQVHGADVAHVGGSGPAGEADALWTTTGGVPLAVFTADCFGVVLQSAGAVGVAHCGWRGAAAGVVAELVKAMTSAGHTPSRVSVGPGISSCCFEVGPEVAGRFDGHVSQTSWGTTSVDLPAAISDQVGEAVVWVVGRCTRHDTGWFSHRRDGDERRLAAIGWLP